MAGPRSMRPLATVCMPARRVGRAAYSSSSLNPLQLDRFRQKVESAYSEGSLPSQREESRRRGESTLRDLLSAATAAQSTESTGTEQRRKKANQSTSARAERPASDASRPSSANGQNALRRLSNGESKGKAASTAFGATSRSISENKRDQDSKADRSEFARQTGQLAQVLTAMKSFDQKRAADADVPPKTASSERRDPASSQLESGSTTSSQSEQPGESKIPELKPGQVRFTLANGAERLTWPRSGGLVMRVSGGRQQLITFPRSWIQDHCQCPKCIQPSTSQKLHRTGDAEAADRDTTPIRIKLEGKDVLRVDGVTAEQDHTYIVPTALFARPELTHHALFEPVHWMGSAVERTPGLRIAWLDMTADAGLYAATVQLIRYGLVVITGVPTDKTSDAECALREVAGRFGEIRNVFYGQTWDVKSIANSKNIAYTDVDLGLHMDLCYFESPPRYQLLHCLRNKVDGGSSYFVDSYNAAEELRTTQPAVFETLCRAKVHFHYDNDGFYYSYDHPTIKRQGSTGANGKIEAVNYSPPFQGPWLPQAADQRLSLPPALHEFEKLLDRPEAKYEFTMREGDLVLFDNRRVLHARRAFKNKAGAETPPDGEATRWLKGCYIDGDVIRNKMRTLTRAAMNGELEVAEHTRNEIGLLSRRAGSEDAI